MGEPRPELGSQRERIASQAPAAAASAEPKQRQSVDPQPKSMAAEPEPQSHRHHVEGVSVRKKEDHFPLIVTTMLIFSAVTFIIGYKYGHHKGVQLAVEKLQPNLKQRTAVSQSAAASQAATPTRPAENTPSSRSGGTEILPTTLKRLNPAQLKASAPIEAPKNYTLQIQTFGRGHQSTANALAQSLKASGFDAFVDPSDGAVFVGRLESIHSSEANRLKNAVSRFNWRQRDFGDAFFRRIPKRLLEN